jgi:hypothetical protein
MITINKNMRWDSMMPSDWDITGGMVQQNNSAYYTGYRKTGFVQYGYDSTYDTSMWADSGYGIVGQGAWALVSLTQEEIDYIMNNSNANYQLSVGSVPMIEQFLIPTVSTVDGVATFEFKDKCVITPANVNSISPFIYGPGVTSGINVFNFNAAVKSTTAGKGSKYKVPSSYTGHSNKQNFTHLVYMFGRATVGTMTGANFTLAQAQALIKAGQLYIDTRQFAAFTVGVEGSGADIIMSDTTIAPGKTIFFGNTPDTKIVVSMNTTLDVVQ